MCKCIIILIFFAALNLKDIHGNIRKLLSAAVEKRLMADRRIGCLLSGGLDSSLVAALLVKHAKKNNLPYKIQSFAIGMNDSPDIIAARQVNEVFTYTHRVSLSFSLTFFFLSWVIMCKKCLGNDSHVTGRRLYWN